MWRPRRVALPRAPSGRRGGTRCRRTILVLEPNTAIPGAVCNAPLSTRHRVVPGKDNLVVDLVFF